MDFSITSITSQSYLEKNWDFKSLLEIKQLSSDKAQQKMMDLVMDLSSDLSRAMKDLKDLGEYCMYLEHRIDRYADPNKPHRDVYFSKVQHLGGIVGQRDVFSDHVHLVKNPGLRKVKNSR